MCGCATTSNWCKAVDQTFRREGLECLELPGATSLAVVGPRTSPRRYTIANCIGDEPKPQNTPLGDYQTTYSHDTTLSASGKADLKRISGLAWMPEVGVNGDSNSKMHSEVHLQDAHWISVSDLDARITATMSSLRYQTEPAAMQRYESCRSFQQSICNSAEKLLVTEEVIEAVPVMDIVWNGSNADGIKASWLRIGAVQAVVKDVSVGHTRITAQAPVAVAARMRPAREVFVDLCNGVNQ